MYLRLREDWEAILNETNSDDIIKNLRTNEFETRKNDLLIGLSRFSNAINAMLGEERASEFLQCFQLQEMQILSQN